MINIETADLVLSFKESLAGRVAHCDLKIRPEELLITTDFISQLEAGSLDDGIAGHFKRAFQERIYGDLIDSVINAQDVALKSAAMVIVAAG